MRFSKKEWLFVLQWTVATAIGLTLGSPFTFGVIFTNGMGGGFENASTYIGLFTLAGMIFGTSIGFCQTFALIGQVKQLILWIPASILGGTLGGLIVGSLGETAMMLSVVMSGSFIGIAQQFVLRKFLKKFRCGWIPVNIIAWIVAQVLFLAGFVVFISTGFVAFQLNPVPALFALLFPGAIPGLITGIYLTWLLKNFKKE